MASSPRRGARLPRRELLAFLVSVNTTMRQLVSLWRVSGRVTIAAAERPDPGTYFRPRRADEYPENQFVAWVVTANRLTELAALCQSWAEYCRDQAVRVDSEGIQVAAPRGRK